MKAITHTLLFFIFSGVLFGPSACHSKLLINQYRQVLFFSISFFQSVSNPFFGTGRLFAGIPGYPSAILGIFEVISYPLLNLCNILYINHIQIHVTLLPEQASHYGIAGSG